MTLQKKERRDIHLGVLLLLCYVVVQKVMPKTI